MKCTQTNVFSSVTQKVNFRQCLYPIYCWYGGFRDIKPHGYQCNRSSFCYSVTVKSNTTLDLKACSCLFRRRFVALLLNSSTKKQSCGAIDSLSLDLNCGWCCWLFTALYHNPKNNAHPCIVGLSILLLTL